MPDTLPPTAVRNELIQKLTSLIRALETHPKWQPPPTNPDRGLYFVWDFVQRTRYIVTELDNIEAGRPLKHPDQIPALLGGVMTGKPAALECYRDVVTRSTTVDMLLGDKTKQRMMGIPESTDFGDDVKAKAKAVVIYIKEN